LNNSSCPQKINRVTDSLHVPRKKQSKSLFLKYIPRKVSLFYNSSCP
jgi:hypothetical protein